MRYPYAYQVVEFGLLVALQQLPEPTPDARAVVVDVMSCRLRHMDVKPIPIRNEPIDKVNDGSGELRAGKVTGRIVHVHRD